MRSIGFFLLLIAMTVPSSGPAQGLDDGGGSLSIYFENDLFAKTDHYYTNGVNISWSSKDLSKFSDTRSSSPLLPLLNRIDFFNRPDFQKNITFSLGQNIYTPDNTQSSKPLPNDRPYAGWLYVGTGVVLKNADYRHTFAINVGIVGPWSLAEQAQSTVHDYRHIPVPKGWKYQLHNEPGFVGVYELTWRWPHHERRVGLGWDFIPHAGFAFGNVYDYINAGGEFRLGLNLPDDFGTDPIHPAATTPTPPEGNQRAARPRYFDIGAYGFVRADGRVVARNIFLDGNTFKDSASVHHKWTVADLSVGAAVNYKNTKVTYALVYRTEEFVGQKGGELFGSVTINVAF